MLNNNDYGNYGNGGMDGNKSIKINSITEDPMFFAFKALIMARKEGLNKDEVNFNLI